MAGNGRLRGRGSTPEAKAWAQRWLSPRRSRSSPPRLQGHKAPRRGAGGRDRRSGAAIGVLVGGVAELADWRMISS